MQLKDKTVVERKSDRELVTSRVINGPLRLVFEAWTQPELFKKWWVPKSFPISLVSCEMDVRSGGSYQLVFGFEGQTKDFFGKYLEVTPCSRIVWTNDEAGEVSVSTVVFEERDGKTRLTMSDLHPSKEALDEAIASGSTSGCTESWDQLEELVVSLSP